MTNVTGMRVLVVGAGLSGLTAAHDLSARGARVEVIEARTRPGGRAWTVHDEASSLHVEAGGEFVDAGQRAIRALCRTLGVPLVPVLHGGFGQALAVGGRTRVHRSSGRAWRAFARQLRPALAAYRRAGGSAGSVAASVIAQASFADSVAGSGAEMRAMADAMRGLYLADPEDLSALVMVEQLADAAASVPQMSRMRGGTERLVAALVATLRGRVVTGAAVRALRQTRSGVRLSIDDDRGRRFERRADYVVMSVPPPLVLDCAFDPPLPAAQRAALATLRMGPATKVAVRFDRPWWRAAGRPRAFGSNLPVGAVWDAAEDQPDAAVLTCLAGGSSSAALRTIVDAEGPGGVARHLRWLGRPSAAAFVGPAVTWEHDPWARGGYAVFPPGFDPRLRPWLGARHGRVVFAGEHTSAHWQGYMNGAVESGQRAAEDLAALHDLVKAGWLP